MLDVTPSKIAAAFRHVTALTGVSLRALKTCPNSAIARTTTPSVGG